MAAKPSPFIPWIVPVLLAVFLWLVAVLSRPFHYDPAHLATLGALYLLLALVIYLPGLVALRWGRLPALIMITGAAFVVALHAREQTRPSGTAQSLDKPAVLIAFLITWALAALILFAALVLLERDPRRQPAGLLLLGVAPLFVLALSLAYHGSDTMRWHLLRHNTLLGAASHHLFAEDTATVRAALWQSHAGLPIPLDVEPAEPLEPPARASDIVFVLIDTLRADALAATGGRGGTMPFLDQLAERSVVFTDVKTNAPWTFPSMASFFTGLLPEEHGAVWGGTLDEAQWTLAEDLEQRGYRRAAFIANAAWMRAELGLAQGFDTFEELHVPGRDYPRAEEITDAALAWLDDTAGGEQPLFLYLHYMDPHVPYIAAGIPDPAGHDTARAAYEVDLAYLDVHLRRLVEGLSERLDGPARLLITADHGEEFGEHGERGHGRALYDEVLRVPALLYELGDGEGKRIDEPLEGRDFFSLVRGLAADPGFDARQWARAHARRERYAASYYTNVSTVYRWLRPYRAAVCLQSIEKDGYTLIWSCQGNTYELYDLRTDPGQLVNIAAREPAVVERLAAAMRAAPAYWTRNITREFSAEELERLRALGYLR